MARTCSACSKDAAGQGGIALLRNQLGRVVRRELGNKEEVGGGDGFAQELDALADERGDGEELFRRGMEAGLLEEGLQMLRLSSSTGRARMCSALSQTALGSKGSSSVKLTTALARLTPSSVKAAVSSSRVRNSRSFFGRPAEEAEEVDESLRAGSRRRDRW